MSSLFERFHQIVDRFFLVSFKFEKSFSKLSKLKNRSKISNPPKFEKKLDLSRSKPIDIHSLFSYKHFELPLDLCWTMRIRTIYRYHTFILFRFCSADWTPFWNLHKLFTTVSKFSKHSYNLRYHFARSHNKYIITFFYSLTSKLIIIMKCCTTHYYSSHIDCFKICHWRHRSGTSD